VCDGLIFPAGIDGGKEIPYMPQKPSKRGQVITSKLTSKSQTTIPMPVRTALRLQEGDELAYSIEDDRVILTKANRRGNDDPFTAFDEWASEADRDAYAKL
jgi:antitoxin PrlF